MSYQEYADKIIERIRKIRTAQGIKQAELAQKIGLSRSSIGNIETGQQTLLLENVYNIAVALNVSMADLLIDENFKQTIKELAPVKKEKVALEILIDGEIVYNKSIKLNTKQ